MCALQRFTTAKARFTTAEVSESRLSSSEVFLYERPIINLNVMNIYYFVGSGPTGGGDSMRIQHIFALLLTVVLSIRNFHLF